MDIYVTAYVTIVVIITDPDREQFNEVFKLNHRSRGGERTI